MHTHMHLTDQIPHNSIIQNTDKNFRYRIGHFLHILNKTVQNLDKKNRFWTLFQIQTILKQDTLELFECQTFRAFGHPQYIAQC